MKKFFVCTAVAVVGIFFVNCNSSKKVMATPVAKFNYESNVQTVIVANCSPCHIPEKGGNKRAYDNFANVKTDIDEIIRRVELSPTDRGFMPMKHPKLADSTVAIFKQWKADGLMEK